jgi:hypothetical protein
VAYGWGDFYESNANVIDMYLVPTLDFATGQPTELRYAAKVIDIVFFIEGGYRG